MHLDRHALGPPLLERRAGVGGSRRHGDRPHLERREQPVHLREHVARRARRPEDDLELELPALEREPSLEPSVPAAGADEADLGDRVHGHSRQLEQVRLLLAATQLDRRHVEERLPARREPDRPQLIVPTRPTSAAGPAA